MSLKLGEGNFFRVFGEISGLGLHRYRTFDDMDIKFPNFYTAICSQNDAGKSNVIRALSLLLEEHNRYLRRRFSTELSFAGDYPKWLSEEDGPICVSAELEIFRDADAGLYSFLNDYLELETGQQTISLVLTMELPKDDGNPSLRISIADKVFEGLKAEEVKNRLRTTLIVHNSTEFGYRLAYTGGLDEFSEEYGKELESIGKKASSSLRRVAKAHKDEIAGLLGRLNCTYKVEITLPDISLHRLRYDLTLGDSKIDVALSEWGSGTRNRTMIFLALLKARQKCALKEKCMRKPNSADAREGHGRQGSFIVEKKARKVSFTDWMRHQVDSLRGKEVYGYRMSVMEPVFGNIGSNKGLRRFSLRGKEVYGYRMSVMEPVFGNIGSNKGLRRFSLRGKEKVQGQWRLYCLIHNIGKLMRYGWMMA